MLVYLCSVHSSYAKLNGAAFVLYAETHQHMYSAFVSTVSTIPQRQATFDFVDALHKLQYILLAYIKVYMANSSPSFLSNLMQMLT